MTWPDGTWPSAAKALAAVFYERYGSGSTRLTFPLELPAIQVRRLGGADDGHTDNARVDVVVIADSEEEAEHLSEEIRSFLVDTRPIRGAGLMLDGAQTEVAPRQVGYADSENPDRAEFIATYVVQSRRF